MERQGNPWQVGEPRFQLGEGVGLPRADLTKTIRTLTYCIGLGVRRVMIPRAQLTGAGIGESVAQSGCELRRIG